MATVKLIEDLTRCILLLIFHDAAFPSSTLREPEVVEAVKRRFAFAALSRDRGDEKVAFLRGTYTKGDRSVIVNQLVVDDDSIQCTVTGGTTADAEVVIYGALDELTGGDATALQRYIQIRQYSSTTTQECDFGLEKALSQPVTDFLQWLAGPEGRTRFVSGPGCFFDVPDDAIRTAMAGQSGDEYDVAFQPHSIRTRIYIIAHGTQKAIPFDLNLDYTSREDQLARRVVVRSDLPYDKHVELVHMLNDALAAPQQRKP